MMRNISRFVKSRNLLRQTQNVPIFQSSVGSFFVSNNSSNHLLTHNSGQLTQVRHITFNVPFLAQGKLDQLRKAAANGDEKSLMEFIRTLAKLNPREALSVIEKGWASKSIPVSESMLREYFKIVGSVNGFDGINISALLALLNANGVIKEEMINNIRAIPHYGGGGSFTTGSTPTDPLYISPIPPTFRSQLFKIVRQAIFLFLMLTFLSSMLDDKSGGGIASRMGMGSPVHQAEHSDKTFNDVVGVDEAKSELQEIVQYLKDPRKFTRLGGKLPKGVLLTGPPGTGKTLLARAIAGEAGVPFYYASGSEFEEMFVGVGARRVRDLFDTAKGKSPCIIFIDEIDAIGGSRHLKEQSSMKMTLNQLLVEMDGFEQNNGVIVIAATNFPETLDSALVRPGRFDKHVDVPMPDIAGRTAILELYSKKMPMSKDVDLEQIARGTPGFSGADLFNLMNQAALKASVEGL
eukprot:gene10978-22939_t